MPFDVEKNNQNVHLFRCPFVILIGIFPFSNRSSTVIFLGVHSAYDGDRALVERGLI